IAQLVVERRMGVFHVTNAGPVSWFEFAREVLTASGQDPDRVLPVATADLQPQRPAPRPANSVLDHAALRLAGIDTMVDFREPLRRLVALLR
ncbi:MAG: sugar nucleotide-binding protein, partial [Acidimicrobiia bacterium]|nr:sugar nucleotide-binding protein [Acidimicrobiia bacterium]